MNQSNSLACPKCNIDNESGAEICRGCGLVFKKYRKTQAGKSQTVKMGHAPPVAKDTSALSIMTFVARANLILGIALGLVQIFFVRSDYSFPIGFALFLNGILVWVFLMVIYEVAKDVQQVRLNSDYMLKASTSPRSKN